MDYHPLKSLDETNKVTESIYGHQVTEENLRKYLTQLISSYRELSHVFDHYLTEQSYKKYLNSISPDKIDPSQNSCTDMMKKLVVIFDKFIYELEKVNKNE